MDKNIVEVTYEGLNLEIDKDVLDNMELVDALAEMQGDDDVLAVSKVAKMILGAENRKKLYEHLRTEKGTVPVAKVAAAVHEIFRAMGEEGKNS